MATMTSQKVRGFLASPRTYPQGGLGFGIGAGGAAAGDPNGPHSTNKIPAGKTPSKIGVVSSNKTAETTKANFQTKAAELKGKGMLDKIKELALEKCAGDEGMAQEFLEGFYEELLSKQAAFGMDIASGLAKDFAGGIGKGLAGVTLGLGVTGLASAVKSISNDKLHGEFSQALMEAIASNPILRQAKKEKVVNYAQTIFKFAPHVATDANLLSSILANAIHGEGVDPQTIKTLTDLEARYTMTNSSTAFSPKAYV